MVGRSSTKQNEEANEEEKKEEEKVNFTSHTIVSPNEKLTLHVARQIG